MHQKEQLIADLSALLGSKNVLTDATALSVYECDAAPFFQGDARCRRLRGYSAASVGYRKVSEHVRRSVHCARGWHRFERWYASLFRVGLSSL